jgi:hypothetical protein
MGVSIGDPARDRFKYMSLTGLRWSDDQCALATTDRCHQINQPSGESTTRLEANDPVGIDQGLVFKSRACLRGFWATHPIDTTDLLQDWHRLTGSWGERSAVDLITGAEPPTTDKIDRDPRVEWALVELRVGA